MTKEMFETRKKAAGLFMIFLIIVLPISSASALAGTITISKNSGQAGLDGFVNANDDTWSVEATVSGLVEGETVAPENVQIKIGNNKKNFNSCSSTDSGATCQYVEPLTGGISPGGYTFDVLYTPITSINGATPSAKTGVINADGLAPVISFSQGNAKQEGTKVKLSFTVNDGASSPCVGLAKVTVLDADSGTVLVTKNDFSEKTCTPYSFADDTTYNGYLSVPFDGEGVKRIKIVAEDRLGHSTTSSIVSFLSDFVKPELTALNFTAFGKFLGSSEKNSPLVVSIKEKSTLSPSSVFASAPNTNLDKTAADSCVREKDNPTHDPNIWDCQWNEVKVNPTDSLAVTVSATDAAGNTAEGTLTQNFVADTDAPVVQYFGPLLENNAVGYAKSGKNTIVLKVKEQGSGIKQENILANLGALGGGSKAPDECAQEADLFVCYWYTSSSFSDTSSDVRIGLEKVVDNAGNQASLPERDLIVDVVPPVVSKIMVSGVSDGAAKNYVQSGDILRVTSTVTEVDGLFWRIDLRNVVNDAETQFPSTKLNDAGWQTFKGEDICKQNEDKNWDCIFETASLKSGLIKNAYVVVQVMDAAGNLAVNWPDPKNAEKRGGKSDEGRYVFDLLAVKDEANPDYWSAGTAKPLLDFVDLDAMTFPTRIPIEISLKSDNLDARALDIELVGCSGGSASAVSPSSTSTTPSTSATTTSPTTPTSSTTGTTANPTTPASPATGSAAATPPGTTSSGATLADDTSPSSTTTTPAPDISRSLIYGNLYPDGTTEPKPTLMLEFSPQSDIRSLLGIKDKKEFKGIDVSYKCQLKIYSRLGNTALKNAELQDVEIKVPFAFSSLGSIDENIAQKVKDMKESDFMKFANGLEYANKAIAWINYALGFMTVIKDAYEIISLFSATQVAAASTFEKTPLAPIGAALRGQCLVMDTSQMAGWKTLEYVNVIAQIFNCNPTDPGDLVKDEKSTGWGLGVYGWWQRSVMESYNKLSGRDVLGIPAKNPYDNIYTSMAALCVPGLIYNVHKAREIQCRQIVCYGKEVPVGIATYDSCDKLYGLQMCEFWTGPAFDFFLFGGLGDLGKIIKNAGANPLGLIKVSEIATCAALCFTDQTPGTLYYSCKAVTGINKLVNIVNSIVSSIDNRPDIQGSPYCDMADSINVDELTGQVPAK